MRAIPLLMGLIVGGTGAVAQEPVTVNLPVEEHVFENGLTLLVLERPGDHRVAAKIFTDMGALNEVPGELGAAHFLEHLMFKGTRTLGTTNWAAEQPLWDSLLVVEAELTAELNRARNALRPRGVFDRSAYATSTPRADSLRVAIARLQQAASAYRDNGAMMRWYQAFGGSRLTATTEQEYMKFDINLPAHRVELFLRVEADRMQNSVFREFDEERMILVEQRLGDLNRPTTRYYEQMNAAVGVVHPVFWPEGYGTDFEQYTRLAEQDLYERYFVPNNTTIVLVGGVALDDMIPLVDRYFGDMVRAPEPLRVRAVEPPPAAERRLLFRSAEMAPRVEARFLIPAVGHPDRPVVDILVGVASRALDDAFEQAGISARVNANTRVVHTERFGVPASVNFEVIVNAETDLPEAERVLLATLDRLKTTVAPARVALVQKNLRMDFYHTALDADRLAFEIGHFQVMDSWRTLERHLEQRENATAEDVARVAARYLIDANRTIGVVRAPERDPSTSEGGA